MRSPRKRVSLTTALGEAEDALRDLLITQPRQWIAGARERMRDLPKTNFDLGCMFAEQGKWFDALFRFQVTLYLAPEYPQLWYNLGCCYFRMGRMAKAKDALLKALKQSPDNAHAIFMLAMIDPTALLPGQRPTLMPLTMVTGFFSSMAQGYDQEEAQNGYQAGKLVHELVKPLLTASAPKVVDLGCGTGIVARPWRTEASTITGVDITPAMRVLAERATHADKKLFESLIEADITALPATLPAGEADLVLCVNVAQFLGDLQGMFTGASRLLAPQGLLVLTAEPHTASTGFGLSAETGRFGHADSYVVDTAKKAGLTLHKQATLALYPDAPAQAWVFSRGAA